MYIERLHLRNIRLLAEQEFSFVNADGSTRMWTVIVGENGVCKSTILQAIALAAMGPKLGSALIKNAQRLRNATSSDEGLITADFEIPTSGHRPPPGQPQLVSSSLIRPDRFDLIPGGQQNPGEETDLDRLRGTRAPGLFIVGYGVGRYLSEPGESSLPTDPIVERVRGLFDIRHRMLGINFYDAFRDQAIAKRFSEHLLAALGKGDPPGERLLPGFCGLDLESHSESLSPMVESSLVELLIDDSRLKLPAKWLSDGYQAMLAWIADLLGHALLDMPKPLGSLDVRGAFVARPDLLQGMVLLDEIDLHLHPTWQRRIVPLLRRIFPKLQFVVSTHSPLVLAGFEREEIILLKLQDGQVVQDPAEIEPGVLTASEILTNFFDVQRAGRPDLVRKERRYLELRAMKRLDAEEREELRQLKKDLDRYLTPSTSLEIEMLSPEEILKRRA